jgi:integrase
MRKAWLYIRKDRPGWYVRWYGDDGRQRSRRLPNKETAERYRNHLEHQMNVGLYFDPQELAWSELVQEYLEYARTVKGGKPATIHEYEKTFTSFERLCGDDLLSSQVTEKVIHQFIAARRAKGTANTTINKDLRHLKAFIRWAIKAEYMGEPARKIDWSQIRQKEPETADARALSLEEFGKLLYWAGKLYGTDWVVRLLLAVGTGLRQQDVEALRIESIDFDRGGLATQSEKTSKGRKLRPLNSDILAEVKDYLGDRTTGRILVDHYHHSKWERICAKASVADVKYHDLRATSGSFIALAGFSTALVQSWLEHETPLLTTKIYLNVSPEQRAAAQAIPAKEALKIRMDLSKKDTIPGPDSDA